MTGSFDDLLCQLARASVTSALFRRHAPDQPRCLEQKRLAVAERLAQLCDLRP